MGLSFDKLQAATTTESMMAKADRDEAERLNAKNSVEEYIYEIRGKICDELEAFNQFGQCMQLAQKAVDSFKAGDEKFNHLDAAEVEKVQKAIAEKQDWFNRMCADVSKMDKTSDPPVLASQFSQEKESFWHMASNILNKPKPKVEPPPPPPAEAAKEEGMETEKAGEESKASEDAPPQKQAE